MHTDRITAIKEIWDSHAQSFSLDQPSKVKHFTDYIFEQIQ